MDLRTVIEHAARLGPVVHLATLGPNGHPHVAPVHVDWLDDLIYCSAGASRAKARNIESQPPVCLHHQVAEESGWDSLMIWGFARLLTSSYDKRRLWSAMSYDLSLFASGGPDDSPDTMYIEIVPVRALFLSRFGIDGRAEWTAE
jgi:general stress protein 26